MHKKKLLRNDNTSNEWRLYRNGPYDIDICIKKNPFV